MRIVALFTALVLCPPVLAGPKDVVQPFPVQQLSADTYVIHGRKACLRSPTRAS